MYRLLLFFFFISGIYPLTCIGQTNETPAFTLYLIGDAGEQSVNMVSYRDTLQHQLFNDNHPHAVVFLGDNVYPKGMPSKGEPDRVESEEIINAQIDLVKNGRSDVYFVPGNHDWKRGRKEGYNYIMNQQQYIDSLKNPLLHALPGNGCPGPVEVPLGDNAVMIIVDTQWLLQPWEKPEGDDSPCDAKSFEDVIAALQDIFLRNEGKRVIIAAHHPIFTYGEHGGVYTLKEHIFPFTDANPKLYIPMPVIGSIYPLYRKLFGDIQDTAHPQNKLFRNAFMKIMEQYPGTIYAAGHEHALQFSIKGSVNYIGSGAGVKTTFVKKKGYSRFALSENGFAKVILYANGTSKIEYYSAVPNQKGKLSFTQSLDKIKKALVPDAITVPLADSMVSNASARYAGNRSHNKWFGENYRDVWGLDIKVPVFDLGKEHGGLKILQRGGGMQTLSLRLADSSGHEYTLRSIEKFPEKAVPEVFRKTFIEDLVQDQISAAHPYGAIVVPPLAHAAGIHYANPKVVYLPDDPRLGIYRKDFANQLMLFEERPAGDGVGLESFGSPDKIISTAKVIEKLAEDNDNHVDQKFVLRSRIFDLFIGDWDRHDDQWRWAVFKGKKGDRYEPIPRDRDQVFFVNEGIVPKLWSRKWALPKFQGFDDELNWPPGFMYNGRYFDRSFLTSLEKEDWILAAEEITSKMTDDVIEKSIHTWPHNVYALHGEEIIRKLKTRRQKLADYALQYYMFLAQAVDVVGSDKKEQFEITRTADGNVEVNAFKLNKHERGKQIYHRVFYPAETNEVRIYGLAGDDEFILNGTYEGSIKVRIIGGAGKDQVNGDAYKHRSETFVYDLKNDISITNQHAIHNETSTKSIINEYNRKAFVYDRLAPLVYGNYNVDDGIFLGGGFLYTTHGFRKSPYKAQHIFLGSYAINTSSFNFKYNGRFTQVVGNWNLEVDADIKSPNYVNNFFGLGNETKFDKHINDKPDVDVEHPIQYYRLRFKESAFEAKLATRIGQAGFFKIGAAFQRMQIEDTKGKDRFIDLYEKTQTEPLIEVSKMFVGGTTDWGVDKRNNKQFTTRGMYFQQASRFMAGLGASAKNFTSHQASVSFYQSFNFPAKVTFALRAGGGVSTGGYEIYQAQILDGKTELRGFRKTRFYGDSKFYTNSEVRIKLASIHSYLFPASLGILGFYDVGRVWYKDNNGIDPSSSTGKSNTWHNGFGGGLWFTPFTLAVVSTEVGHSREGTLLYLRLGFLF